MLNLNKSALLKTMKNKINSCEYKQNIGKDIKLHYHKCNNVNGYNNYMQIAIDVAERQLVKQPHIGHEHEIPIGCVIVDNKTGKILAKSCNKTIKSNNSLQHAEIICINRTLKKLSTNRLTNCSMYVTLEPCIMCAGAIMLSKIDRLYIGCLSKKTGAVISNIHLFQRNICNHIPDVYYGIMEQECKTLLRGFFRDIN